MLITVLKSSKKKYICAQFVVDFEGVIIRKQSKKQQSFTVKLKAFSRFRQVLEGIKSSKPFIYCNSYYIFTAKGTTLLDTPVQLLINADI